ncbi:uncharacterized protein N7459_008113 [Penicillium hispanicum]|uniref:uncharacterized protein n=1 Tax=Penicillium hispanicum TaxID=1080232 RepID=UPI00253FB184|nr:uncharacterized protein N7459_008113 [Penicillium hispanicum]KAJ5573686.1 hypothetical protein N7459_008113 [Penicillium hispanicum]
MSEEWVMLGLVPVVKLRGSSNYRLWAFSLEVALRVRDPEYWGILIDKDPLPEADASSILTSQCWARFCVARNRRVAPADVTEQQIRKHVFAMQPIRQEFDQYLTCVNSKRKVAAPIVLGLLTSTLNVDCEGLPGSAQEAFEWLRNKYGDERHVDEHPAWIQFCDLRWRGDDRNLFIRQFRYLFRELARATDLRSPEVALCQFINAIRAHEEDWRGIQPALMHFNPTEGMAKIYQAFLALP